MIVKLTEKHINMIEDIFTHRKHMSITHEHQPELNVVMRENFCNTYLTGLDNFHAFGIIEDNKIISFVTFYESVEDPSWYYTGARNIGDPKNVRDVLDSVLEYNEKNGRLKWFTLLPEKHFAARRRFFLSANAIERYEYVDEYTVEARHKTFFNPHWEILFKRNLMTQKSTIRCSFLKNKYRTSLPNLGNI